MSWRRWLVGWLSRACTVAKRCILGNSYYGTLIGNPTPGIQWYNFRPPGVTPKWGIGPPVRRFLSNYFDLLLLFPLPKVFIFLGMCIGSIWRAPALGGLIAACPSWKRREDGCDDLFDCIIFLAEWFCFILFLISYLFLVVSIFIWQIKLTNRQIFDWFWLHVKYLCVVSYCKKLHVMCTVCT